MTTVVPASVIPTRNNVKFPAVQQGYNIYFYNNSGPISIPPGSSYLFDTGYQISQVDPTQRIIVHPTP